MIGMNDEQQDDILPLRCVDEEHHSKCNNCVQMNFQLSLGFEQRSFYCGVIWPLNYGTGHKSIHLNDNKFIEKK